MLYNKVDLMIYLQYLSNRTMHHERVLLVFVTLLIYHVESQHFGRMRDHLAEEDCHFNICESTQDYPEDEVREIIKRNPDFRSYFGNVIAPAASPVIDIRFGGFGYESFCTSIEESRAPTSMPDTDNIIRTIANVDGFRQVIKFQKCDYSRGSQCFPGNWLQRQTKCLQKFHVIKLLAVVNNNNNNNTLLEFRDFKIPAICACSYV